MEIALYPAPDQIESLTRAAEGPVVMVNLLRFKRAPGDRADDSPSGAAVYRRYAARMRAIVEAAGGRFLWAGRVAGLVIGRSDVAFDAVGLVEYPSRAAFLEIVASPEVQAVASIRAEGLEGQWLIATTPTSLDDESV